MKRQFSFFIIFALSFIEFFHPITTFTQDLGRHLKLGEIILQTHTVPKTNLFSYTYPNFQFINTHWLSEVIFYFITHFFTLQGLLLTMSLTAALSFFINVITSIRYTNKPNFLVIFFSSLLYLGVLLERTDLRPEIFSFLFMTIFMLILYKTRETCVNSEQNIHTSSLLWLSFLPIIEIAWVNMHIYFIIGPLLILLFFIDAVFVSKLFTIFYYHFNKKYLMNLFKQPSYKYTISLLFIFLLTCLVSLLNPNGFSGAFYPFNVFYNYGYSIAENQTIFFLINYGFLHSAYVYFGVTFVLLLLLISFNLKKARPIDFLLFIVFSIIACSSTRNFPLYVFATFPTFVYLMNPIWEKIKNFHKFYMILIGITSILFAMNLFTFISQNGLAFGITNGAEGGINFFLQNNLHGPIFNNFDIGSYLDYRLYPKEKVFVDGRPEAYPAIFFQNTYIPMQEDMSTFDKADKNYHFSTIFFSYTDQTPWAKKFLANIMHNQEWQLVYLDGFSSVWIKKNTSNEVLIEKYAITQDTFTPPSLQNSQSYFQLLYFLELIQWKNAELKILQKIIDTDPTNCYALGLLAQDPSTTFLYNQRYQFSCK